MKTQNIKYVLGNWRSCLISAVARSHINCLLHNPVGADCKLTNLGVYLKCFNIYDMDKRCQKA